MKKLVNAQKKALENYLIGRLNTDYTMALKIIEGLKVRGEVGFDGLVSVSESGMETIIQKLGLWLNPGDIQDLVEVLHVIGQAGMRDEATMCFTCETFAFVRGSRDRRFQNPRTPCPNNSSHPMVGVLVEDKESTTFVHWVTRQRRPMSDFPDGFDTTLGDIRVPVFDKAVVVSLADDFGEVLHPMMEKALVDGSKVQFIGYLLHHIGASKGITTWTEALSVLYNPKFKGFLPANIASHVSSASQFELEEKKAEENKSGGNGGKKGPKSSLSPVDRDEIAHYIGSQGWLDLVALDAGLGKCRSGVELEVLVQDTWDKAERLGSLDRLIEGLISRAPVLEDILAKYQRVFITNPHGHGVNTLTRSQAKEARVVLAREIPTGKEVLVVCKDAGIEPSRVDLDGPAEMQWQFVIQEACRSGIECLHSLLYQAVSHAPSLAVEFRRINQM